MINDSLRRRDFLGAASVGAALMTAPTAVAAQSKRRIGVGDIQTAAPLEWQDVAALFAFPPGYIALNAANLCPTSRPVVDAQREMTNDVNTDPSFENRFKLDEMKEDVRSKLAAMVGGDPDEIAITRNTSESNCTIVSGLDLGAGDEVVLWDQNHESNSLSWQEASERHGFKIIKVSTPAVPRSNEDLIAPFAAALGPRTRILAFSHVSNMTGVRLPAKELCALARAKGALSLVDGAQTFAVLPLNLGEMGCDFYTASMHKWFAGPRECGILYVKKDRIGSLWPTILGHGWDEKRKTSARKFDCLGQQEDGRVLAIGRAIDVHNAIGGERIYKRILELNAYLKKQLAGQVQGCEFMTPADPNLSAGITVFRLQKSEADQIRQTLYGKYQTSVLCIPTGEGQTLLRLCPHIYNNHGQLDRIVAALAEIAGNS